MTMTVISGKDYGRHFISSGRNTGEDPEYGYRTQCTVTSAEFRRGAPESREPESFCPALIVDAGEFQAAGALPMPWTIIT